jgi:hypothetical protein
MTGDPQVIRLCTTERCFADDIESTCDLCGCPVFHRPHKAVSDVKWCLPCYAKRANHAEDTFAVTKETVNEMKLLALFGRRHETVQ